jgi:hypothetical protein
LRNNRSCLFDGDGSDDADGTRAGPGANETFLAVFDFRFFEVGLLAVFVFVDTLRCMGL